MVEGKNHKQENIRPQRVDGHATFSLLSPDKFAIFYFKVALIHYGWYLIIL